MAQLATHRLPNALATGVRELGVASARRSLDAESASWLRALSAVGAERDDAVWRLHELLLRAARFEVARRQRTASAGSGSGDLDDLAMQAAADALVAVLGKLHSLSLIHI